MSVLKPEHNTNSRGHRLGAKTLFSATVVSQLCALCRFTVLARLLGPEQLGLSATLILTQSFFDMVSDSGADRFLVQDEGGDLVEVQRLAQLVFVIRGMASAFALVLFAVPLAKFYGAPKLAPALMFLALSPLVFGFVHLDFRRVQRRHDFRPEAWTILLGETIALLVTLVAAVWRRDFTAVIYGAIARSIVVVAVSHLRAERPFSVAFSRAHAPRLAAFSAPLMLNGALLFLGLQGDRILIANRLGLTALGLFSAASLLANYPVNIVLRYIATMYLPIISREPTNATTSSQAENILGGTACVLALAISVGFSVTGPLALPAFFGARYHQSLMTVSMIGILQATRFFRVWPHTTALAQGRSLVILIDNIARLSAFPLALLLVVIWPNLDSVLSGYIVGEMAALWVGIIMLNVIRGQPATAKSGRLLLFGLTAVLIVTFAKVIQVEDLGLSIVCGVSAGLLLWRVWIGERHAIVGLLALGRQVLNQGRERAS